MLRRVFTALTVVGFLTLSLGAGFTVAQRAAASPYTVCASGCAYVSINDALAAAASGATITVGPGVYGPNEVGATTPDTQIKVTKSVRLVGAGIGQSIINDAPANQGTATGGVISISTPTVPGNITISGFTIEGAIVNDSNDDGILMVIDDTNSSDKVTVKDNLFYGDTTLDPNLLQDQTDSIVVQQSTATVDVTHNTFQGVFRAALVESNPGPFKFTFNDVNLHPIYDPTVSGMIDNWAEGIWFLADDGNTMQASSVVSDNTFESYQGLAVGLNGGYHASYKGAIKNITIKNNTFNDTGIVATYSNPQESSVVLLHGWEPTNGDASSTVSGISIDNNVFNQAGGSGHGFGIGLLGSVTSNINIKGNDLEGAGSLPSAGIDFASMYPAARVHITNNIIRGFTNGGNADTLPNGAKITASQNCISDNSAYGFAAAGGAVNAEQNWWGSPNGPSPTGPGTTLFYGNPVTTPEVDATNFLTTPIDACAGPVVSNVQSNINPAPINVPFTVTATLSTDTTSHAPVAAAYYTVNFGTPTQITTTTSGTFGTSTTVDVSAILSGIPKIEVYHICVFGVDTEGNWGPQVQPNQTNCFVENINSANTTTTIISNNNPSVYGQSVTFTVTVASGFGPPTGAVSITDNGNPLAGPLTLDGSGVATFTTSALTVGTHSLVASYAGDSSGLPIFNPSTSGTLKQVVNLVGTTTGVTSAPSPSVSGQTVTISVHVHAADSSALSGSVVLKDGATTLATLTLSGGAATYTTSALSVGTHNLTAAYSGDATHDVSSGAATQTVTATPVVPTGTNNAYIRIVQSSESYTTSDIGIDGAVTFPNVAACTAQPYYPITAGKHTFTVQTPSGGATVITETLTLTAGQYYTLAVVGNSAKAIIPALLVFQDDNSVTPNQAKARVYHLADTLGPVLVTSGSVTLAANLTFGAATSYRSQAPGTVAYSFQPGSGPALTDTLNEAANQVYSIFLLCNGQVTNAAATGVPVSLPQTGYGPSAWLSAMEVRALLLTGALLLLLGLGGFGSYFVMARRRRLAL